MTSALYRIWKNIPGKKKHEIYLDEKANMCHELCRYLHRDCVAVYTVIVSLFTP